MNLYMDGRGIVKSVDIFDNRVHVRHTGTDFGIVNPMATDPSFGCQIDRLILASDRSCIAAPCLGRGTKVTHLYDFDSSCRPGRAFAEWGGVRSLVDRFYEPDEYCDGVIINTTDEAMQKVAILMMTADAGVAKIFAPNGELAVLNCGLDNVDSSGGDSIVENAINYFTERSVGKKFSPRDLRLVIGEAAQACCFGLDRILKILRE
ncbi:hypothetical protein HZC20_02515 [Candidatus Peregrinibacteria bacterium]|nr:hypothetical protein [Candidatus Peregrinibacteria bacterium]